MALVQGQDAKLWFFDANKDLSHSLNKCPHHLFLVSACRKLQCSATLEQAVQFNKNPFGLAPPSGPLQMEQARQF